MSAISALFLGSPSPWIGPLIFIAAGAAIGLGSILVGMLVRPKNPGRVKNRAYECGMNPVGDARERVPIRYYTVAMLFLLFDAEAVFLWPWAVAWKKEGFFFAAEAIIFIVLVGAGYAYAWGKGAFEWRKM